MNFLKVVFDNVIFKLQKAGGISVYWYELIVRFSKIHDDSIFLGYENDNIFFRKLSLVNEKKISIPIAFSRYLPIFTFSKTPFIFHSSYYRVAYSSNAANITTVHDFTYEYYFSGMSKYIHSSQKKLAVNFSDGIICVSECTKNDLIKFFPHIDPSIIKVIYNGVSDEFYPLDCLPNSSSYKSLCIDGKKFILFVGDRSSYKNFDLAVTTAKNCQCHLFVVGGKELTKDETSSLKENLNENFHHYRGLTSEDLNALYNSAFCLLYPSSYEGFGIPILEAMKAGCPVVSTNLSSIPEVAGDAALLASKADVSEFTELVLKLDNPEFRNNLIEKGFIQAKKFSWDKCFEETYAFYKEVYKRKFG